MFIPFHKYVDLLHIGEDILEFCFAFVRIHPAVDVHVGCEHLIGIRRVEDSNDRLNIPTIIPPTVDNNLFNVTFLDALVGTKLERGNLKLPQVSLIRIHVIPRAIVEMHFFCLFRGFQLYSHVRAMVRASISNTTSESHDINFSATFN